MTFIWLAGAIQAMNLGLGVISKEVSGKTADFLLSKPVSRNKMLFQKFASALILIVITNLVFTLSAAMSAKLFSPSSFNMKLFLLVSFSLFFVQLFFLAVGFVAGVVLPKVKTVVSVTLPVVFALFIVASFGAIVDRPEVYYVTPFKYFDATYIFQHGHYEPKYMLILAGVVIVSLVISFAVYNRKDIPQL
jgi:ABC-2 type transport system permease protein